MTRSRRLTSQRAFAISCQLTRVANSQIACSAGVFVCFLHCFPKVDISVNTAQKECQLLLMGASSKQARVPKMQKTAERAKQQTSLCMNLPQEELYEESIPCFCFTVVVLSYWISLELLPGACC